MTTTSSSPTAPKKTIEIVTVVLLSITAVLTAWCGFQASKWGGEMSIAFSEASSARVQATAAEGEARDARQYDLTIYTQWVLADADGNTELVDFVEQRFTPEFRTAFDAWERGGRAERGPFAMTEYEPPGTAQAEQLGAQADSRFVAALENNQRGDDYALLTVLFALVLFLTALAQRDLAVWVRRAFLGLALAVATGGVVLMATFPVKI